MLTSALDGEEKCIQNFAWKTRDNLNLKYGIIMCTGFICLSTGSSSMGEAPINMVMNLQVP
jgi:hypothetical protein